LEWAFTRAIFFPRRQRNGSNSIALPGDEIKAGLKSAHAGVTGVKNNERFARAGKTNVYGKRPLTRWRFGWRGTPSAIVK
jgi:hypothetical protein